MVMSLGATEARTRQVSKLSRACFAGILLMLAPGMITHVGPMMFAYIWLMLVCECVLVCIAALLQRLPLLRSANQLYRAVVFRVSCAPLVIIMQTLFNYAVLVYDLPQLISGHDYINVLATEWNLRSTACYVNSITNSARHIRIV